MFLCPEEGATAGGAPGTMPSLGGPVASTSNAPAACPAAPATPGPSTSAVVYQDEDTRSSFTTADDSDAESFKGKFSCWDIFGLNVVAEIGKSSAVRLFIYRAGKCGFILASLLRN